MPRTPPKRARRKLSARELGERFNCSPRTIRGLIAEERDVYLARAAERHEKMRQLPAQGLSLRAIAAELGCAASTVSRALRKPASAAAPLGGETGPDHR